MTATDQARNLVWMDGYEVDRDKFLPVYHRFRELTDHDVAMTPFRISVTVFNELVNDGWPTDQARYYMFAARKACEEHLDPKTGAPLTGTAAIHPVRVAEAAKLVREVMPDDLGDELAETLAARVVEALADAGWKPAS